MKVKVTMLHLLDEGDRFQFANENGTLKSNKIYYVEGQYPKFHCTTVCGDHNIVPCCGGECKCMNVVTGVEDTQWVHLVKKHAIDICHEITAIR